MPRAAADALALPREALFLELHVISFSHYCARAKWYLGACGLRAEIHALMPVEHVPHMIALLKRFRAPRAPPTASSRSPAATPALAGYRVVGAGGGAKAPLFLLQDSELIGRWAALRAQALGDGGAAARALYGADARLSVSVSREEAAAGAEDGGGGGSGGGKTEEGVVVAHAVLECPPSSPRSPTPAELERRLSGAMGVESRRLVYFHLLPRRALMMRLASLNAPASASWWARNVSGPAWGLAASLALPSLLGVNAPAVDRGARLLDAEFDFLDALVEARGCLVRPRGWGGGSAGGPGGDGDGDERVGAFLCGGAAASPSVADVSLATLASPLVGDVVGYGARVPLEREQPEGMRRMMRERYSGRPTARYVRALWREHGAAAVAAGGSGGGAGPAPMARL
jgi:hypothetical protein